MSGAVFYGELLVLLAVSCLLGSIGGWLTHPLRDGSNTALALYFIDCLFAAVAYACFARFGRSPLILLNMIWDLAFGLSWVGALSLVSSERLTWQQWFGVALAFVGLILARGTET